MIEEYDSVKKSMESLLSSLELIPPTILGLSKRISDLELAICETGKTINQMLCRIIQLEKTVHLIGCDVITIQEQGVN